MPTVLLSPRPDVAYHAEIAADVSRAEEELRLEREASEGQARRRAAAQRAPEPAPATAAGPRSEFLFD